LLFSTFPVTCLAKLPPQRHDGPRNPVAHPRPDEKSQGTGEFRRRRPVNILLGQEIAGSVCPFLTLTRPPKTGRCPSEKRVPSFDAPLRRPVAQRRLAGPGPQSVADEVAGLCQGNRMAGEAGGSRLTG
jgi:hypothetical protein